MLYSSHATLSLGCRDVLLDFKLKAPTTRQKPQDLAEKPRVDFFTQGSVLRPEGSLLSVAVSGQGLPIATPTRFDVEGAAGDGSWLL